MTKNNYPYNDLVIAFKPEAKPEEEKQFLNEFAQVILAVSRYLVALEGGEQLDTIEF